MNANETLNELQPNQGTLCKISGHIFSVDEMNMDIEYPCKDISYAEYLKKNLPSNYKIKDDNWKILYASKHRVPDTKHLPIAV